MGDDRIRRTGSKDAETYKFARRRESWSTADWTAE